MTPHLGILAYGSLIDDPGEELEPLIRNRIKGVDTPFRIEFARSSSSRDGAPTLVPVETGGASVSGVLLVLSEEVDRSQAEDLLWRRETRNEGTDKHYSPLVNPGPNKVIVKSDNIDGVEVALFTQIGTNIDNLSAEHLADLAIKSARGNAGDSGKDGISYLMSVLRQGISTPLTPEYRNSILQKTASNDLEEALRKVRSGDA